MELLYGKPVADRVLSEIAKLDLIDDTPHLVIYLVGDDPASLIYARSKEKKGASLGAKVTVKRFDSDVGEERFLEMVREDARSSEVHGIVVERPIPEGWDRFRIQGAIPPEKDLEAQCPVNFGLMAQGRPRFVPPTPLGALLIMHHYCVEITGKNIVVMGRSPTVGYPLGMLLSQKIQWANGTVSLVNAASQDPGCLLAGADIVISAVGKPLFLKGGMLKKGSTIIDMGINCDENGRIVGDADLGSMEGIASRATPTPGGTGAVTVACMFLNLHRAWLIQKGYDGSHGDPIIRMIYSDIA